jgi:hypothetical protein
MITTTSGFRSLKLGSLERNKVQPLISAGKAKAGVCRCGYGKSLHFEKAEDYDFRPLAVRGVTCRDYVDSEKFEDFINTEEAVLELAKLHQLDYDDDDDLLEGDGSVYLD